MPSRDWTKLFRQQVGSLKDPRRAVQQLRAMLGTEDPRALFGSLRANPMFRGAAARNHSPQAFGDLWSARRMAPQGIESELAWNAEVVLLFSDKISTFLECERQFDRAYIVGDWPECLAVLDRLEAQQGLSLWLISRRLTVLRLSGLAGDNSYADSLIASASSGTIISWIVFMMNFRADPNLAPASYIRQVSQSLAGASLPANIETFLRYHALSMVPQNRAECAAILATSETAPLIDRYIALVDVLQALVVAERANSAAFLPTVARLEAGLPDQRIELLADVLDPAREGRLIDRLDVAAADLYTSGDYAGTVERLVAELRSHPERTNLYVLLARAMLRGKLNPELPQRISEITRLMSAIQIFAEDDEAAMSELSREVLTGAHRPLAASVRALFNGRSKDPSAEVPDASLEALASLRLTPLQLRNLPAADRAALIRAARTREPDSVSLALQQAILGFGSALLDPGLQERLPHDRAALYAARSLVRIGRFAEAIPLLQELQEHSLDIVANDARREMFEAFTNAGQVRDALRVVASSYAHNEKLHVIFALSPLLDAIEAGEAELPFDEIALSICYHVHNRFGGDTRLGAQADAAEEYALAHHADVPSKIGFDPNHPDIALAPVYLDEVCSPAILDKFMAIDDVDQVELERLEICRILAEINPARRQGYLDEIREITRRRVVRDRFEQVERTKIYVDTDGVKRQAEKTLRDTYVRFLATLADVDQSNERMEMLRKVQDILAEIKTDGVKIHFPDLPASERDRLFDRLLASVMRMLVSSQQYGLEAYLSTRVRHGTMGNQLRSAFEVQGLLTQRDAGMYQPDHSWSNGLGLASKPQGEWLAERLARFSEDLDGAIERLVRKRIQVNSDVEPEGLFRFHAYNFDLVKLQSEITPETTFDAFLDGVIERFWGVLERTLTVVRAYIERDFLNIVQELADNLGRDLDRELAGLNISKLRDAVMAGRTQMAVNVANVASWFTLARDMERPDYEFGIAVEVATESIRVCHPGLDIKLHRKDDVSFDCRGRTLESLVYMLFTALDNAIEHCGLADQAPEIGLTTTCSDDWLELRLTNSCAPVPDIEEANARLAALRERLQNDADLQGLATKEGGTGYAKILRILRHDLLARHSLTFGYEGATEYAVTIGLDAKAIVK